MLILAWLLSCPSPEFFLKSWGWLCRKPRILCETDFFIGTLVLHDDSERASDIGAVRSTGFTFFRSHHVGPLLPQEFEQGHFACAVEEVRVRVLDVDIKVPLFQVLSQSEMLVLYIIHGWVDCECDAQHLLVTQSVNCLSLNVSWPKLDHSILRQIVLLARLYLLDQTRDPWLDKGNRLGADLRESEEPDLKVETLGDCRRVSHHRRLEGNKVESNPRSAQRIARL